MTKSQLLGILLMVLFVQGTAGLSAEEGIHELMRGNLLAKQGDYSNALVAFDQAITKNPRLAQAFSHKAATLVKMGNFPEALKECNKAIKLDSRYVHAYVLRGLIYKHLGKRGKELHDMRLAKRLMQKRTHKA